MSSSKFFSSSNTLLVAVAIFKQSEKQPLSGGPRLEHAYYNPSEEETLIFSSRQRRVCADLNINQRIQAMGISGQVDKEVWLL